MKFVRQFAPIMDRSVISTILISRVLEALKNTGADQNRVIIFTSDHGEMLGERGMWFKKHFFEKSMHIPLIVNAPWVAPARVRELVSLVDLLPTFNAIAGLTRLLSR